MYRRTNLLPGDIILVAGEQPGSSGLSRALGAMIRWATVSPFQHAALVGQGELIEALVRVQVSRLSSYALTGWVYRVEATSEQRLAAVSWAKAHIGLPYSIATLMEDGLREIAHIPVLPKVMPTRYTCSGFVTAAYAAAGVIITYAPLPSPQDVACSALLSGSRPWSFTP